MNADRNERLLAVLWDWWFNEPVEDEGSSEANAMDDMRRLVAKLDAAGFTIVEKDAANRGG